MSVATATEAPRLWGAPGSIGWLARHELRLSWRDWRFLVTGGSASRGRKVAIAVMVGAILAHAFAWFVLHRFTAADFQSVRANFLLLTAGLVLYFCLMISQSMEAATRVLYARADLDLFHSSPARLTRIFVVRLTMIGATIATMGIVVASAFINVATALYGSFWLSAYGVVVAMGALAASIAIVLTGLLFRLIGARRTRTAAQLSAAIIGALFVIGLQIVAIFTTGTLSQIKVLQEDWVIAQTPDENSPVWWPARAAMGDLQLLLLVLTVALGVFVLVVALGSRRFVGFSLQAVNAGDLNDSARRRVLEKFRWTSSMQALRRKEWVLILRDPWLISQTAMQLMYLLPPALLLWHQYGGDTNILALVIPVLVMASGQLAGGLAWLAISGEDAPDLVATAPIAAASLVRPKVEAVMGATMVVIAPFVVVFAFLSPLHAVILAIAVALDAGCSTMVQLWFRAQAKRAQFHRRQTSSRIATFAEALSSVGWAGTSGLFASGIWTIGAISAGLTVSVLLLTRMLAPRN